MAETPQDESGPAEPPANNNPPVRDGDILQQVLALLSTPLLEDAEPSALQQENRQLRSTLSRMTSLLRDKTSACITLEKKIEALNVQVSSLKDVVSLTKDLLNIRNMEIQHLHADMNDVQSKMEIQRTRHNDMINKLDNALTLNGQLKREYETQLKLFRELQEKYEQRAKLLEKTKSIPSEPVAE